MSQKAMAETSLRLNTLKACLTNIALFTDTLSADPVVKDCLEMLGREAGEIISAKENTAIAYYSSLAPLLDERALLKDPNARAILAQALKDQARLKKLKTILFLMYPRILDHFIYNGFAEKVQKLYEQYPK